MNIILICNKVGHEDNQIIGICTDPLCQHQRSCCGLCVIQDHNTHTQSIQDIKQVKKQYKKEDSLLEFVHELRNKINQQLNIIEKNIKMMEVPLFPDEINITNINKLGESICNARKVKQSNFKEQLQQISQAISNQLDIYLNRVKRENQQNQEMQLQRQLEKQRQRERELKEQKERELQEQKERELKAQHEYEIDQKSNEFRMQGDDFYSQQKYLQAIEKYDVSLNVNQKNHHCWNNKGMALQSLDRQEEAILCFGRAIEINPFAIYYSNQANSLRLCSRLKEALEMVNQAIELDPQHSDSWNQKGLILSNLNRKKEALQCLQKAVKLEPSDNKLFNLGFVLQDLGQLEDAVICYYKTLEYNPQNYDALDKISEIQLIQYFKNLC